MGKDIVVSCLIMWLTYQVASSTFRTAISTRRGRLLTYSRATIMIGFGFVAFALMIPLSAFMTPEITAVGIRNAGLAFVLVSIPGTWLVRMVTRGPILITDKEIIRIKRHGVRERIRWRDVATIERGVIGLAYRVRARNGQAISVSDLLSGQPQFAQSVLDSVPTSLIACESSLRRRCK